MAPIAEGLEVRYFEAVSALVNRYDMIYDACRCCYSAFRTLLAERVLGDIVVAHSAPMLALVKRSVLVASASLRLADSNCGCLIIVCVLVVGYCVIVAHRLCAKG